jgi:ribonuclease HI
VKAFGVQDLAEFVARLGELRTTYEPPTAAGEFLAYTDGACFGNPQGPGGWAAAVLTDVRTWHLFGHLSSTSNNRAEALGVLGALEWVPPGSTLYLRTDSELTLRLFEGVYKVKSNTDIWAEIRRVRAEKHLDVAAEWVRGHAGDPLNELADRLSKLGARNATLDELGSGVQAPKPAESQLAGLVPQGDWEREFLRSVKDQLRRGRALSPKQQAVVDRIRARGGKNSAHEGAPQAESPG